MKLNEKKRFLILVCNLIPFCYSPDLKDREVGERGREKRQRQRKR